VLVIPITRGGCDRWGWNPSQPNDVRNRDTVRDLGFEANQQQRSRQILRLNSAVIADAAHHEGQPEERGDRLRREAAFELGRAFERWFSANEAFRDTSDDTVLSAFFGAPPVPQSWRNLLGDHDSDRWKVVRAGDGRVLALERRSPQNGRYDFVGIAVTEDDVDSLGMRDRDQAIPLLFHSKGVRSYAGQYATRLRLHESVVHDIELAAYLHDTGKAHPAFQRWLHGGNRVAALLHQDQPLAKSGRWIPPSARAASGLPRGARHEIASVLCAAQSAEFRQARDGELVLWLIGTHHGRGRPWFPLVDWPVMGESFEIMFDGSQRSVKVDTNMANFQASWYDLERNVYERYGAWELAYFESIIRLADHRRSRDESAEYQMQLRQEGRKMK